MGKNGALTFRDIAGKLDVLRIECSKCGRSGRYDVRRLIELPGLDMELPHWKGIVAADCPMMQSTRIYDRCGAGMPDLIRLTPETPSIERRRMVNRDQ